MQRATLLLLYLASGDVLPKLDEFVGQILTRHLATSYIEIRFCLIVNCKGNDYVVITS